MQGEEVGEGGWRSGFTNNVSNGDRKLVSFACGNG